VERLSLHQQKCHSWSLSGQYPCFHLLMIFHTSDKHLPTSCFPAHSCSSICILKHILHYNHGLFIIVLYYISEWHCA
jgi:hypothetical protein